MTVIEMWTVRYVTSDYEKESVTVYAYPSGGVGMSASDPAVAEALSGVRSLVDGIDPAQAVVLAARLTDVVRVLTNGHVDAYHIVETEERP